MMDAKVVKLTFLYVGLCLFIVFNMNAMAQDAYRADSKELNPEVAGVYCPNDYLVSQTYQSPGYASLTSCEKARGGKKPCTFQMGTPAGCKKHCLQKPLCFPSLKDKHTTVGDRCFAVEGGQYHYTCINTATCHCV